jgi:uncharacterized membrane protein
MMVGFGLLVLLLVGGLIFALVFGGPGSLSQFGAFRPSDDQRRRTARQVLDERLARGEIDRDEYEAIRARIEQ